MGSMFTAPPASSAPAKDPRARRISQNFATAKGLAALTVMLGHYAHIPNFWVVVTVALLVFTISSGYFTWERYHGDFSHSRFWRSKLTRLLPHLLVIESFLLCLFLYKGLDGIWTWHTLINLVGLNGFLNWFHIPNQSPYGLGMWFLTLLLVFYAAYPFLERLYRAGGNAVTMTGGGLLGLFILHLTVPYGHALWLTAAGYLAGLFVARRQLRLPPFVSLALIGGAAVSMVLLRFLGQASAGNFIFILITAGAGMLLLMEIEIPAPLTLTASWLSGMLFEIYLLHPYLFFSPTKIQALNVTLSMGIVTAVSAILARGAHELGQKFLPARRAP